MMSFDDLYLDVKKEFPAFKLVPKNQNFWMELIGLALYVITFGQQKTFMTDFLTTVGCTVYTPIGWEQWDVYKKMELLRHERVHMRQARRHGLFLFTLMYFFPFFPVFLAYGRARLEWEAYTESLRALAEYNGSKILYSPPLKDHIVQFFTTGKYGWMWPFKKTVERWYDEAVREITKS